MCLILFSFDDTSSIPFIAAANRDEFYQRPTAAVHYWQAHPKILAGRDLVGGGTWMGITVDGRFAAVTNVREPDIVVNNPLSRGALTRGFLTGNQSPSDYLLAVEASKMRYRGFNLLVGELTSDKRELFYLSNRQDGIIQLASGVYGLSNHLLDSNWPKVERGKEYLRHALDNQSDIQQYHYTLRRFLEDSSLADDDTLPQTGVSYEREKALSAAFITLPDYGTRASTILTINHNSICVSEKSYGPSNSSSEEGITMFHIPL
ncbi:hypothetical protein AB835_01885 [Candidatus Endobugula sertula]|uniref:NRDE family protein n=1 Tax=Candidatus Endobugula sertula TaxID=62101 RepID=A0A1D2QTC3_9GAMM|nr:hypothetical protein AB835_01885 [Candidatus Endobugula sertula]